MKVTINNVEIEILGECEDIKINGNKVTIKPKTKVIKDTKTEYIPYYPKPYYPQTYPYPYPNTYPWTIWCTGDNTSGYIEYSRQDSTVSGNPIKITSDTVTTTSGVIDWCDPCEITADQIATWKKTLTRSS